MKPEDFAQFLRDRKASAILRTQVKPDASFPPGDCDIDGIAALHTSQDP
jgi:hypothetical protein